jgi:hypothetical protein
MGGLFAVLLVVVGVAVVAIILLQYYQEQKRTEEMQGAAGRMGFSFQSEGEPGLLGRLGRFHLFSQGRSRKIHNMMHKRIDDLAVMLFDYRYTTSSGKHSHTHNQTVLLLETERLRLPFFSLRPEGLLHKLAGSFGYQDIDFEVHPVFSETYLLQGDDEARVRAAFGEDVLGYYARHDKLCTEGEGQHLTFYRADRRVQPWQMEGFVKQGLEVLDLFVAKEEAGDSLPALEADHEEAQRLDEVLAQLKLEGLE